MQTVTAYIALGANLGEREASIRAAIMRLENTPNIRVLDTAPLIETAPWGKPDQPRFMNTVCAVKISLSPRELLDRCLNIEHDLGRDRSPSATHWGPRVIDLYIILYSERIVNEPGITIPHPEMHRRAFVLEPLAAIAPEVLHPTRKKTVQQLLNAISENHDAQSQ